jgi:hypothetical protein
MKFMVFVKANKESEVLPDEQLLSEMSKYNEELVKAGILLDGGGLQPTARSARVKFQGRQRTVVEGPFTEAKDLVAGYWLLECKSLAECIEWVKRCPNPHLGESEIEIRPLFGMEDFPAANAETIERNERILAQARAQS